MFPSRKESHRVLEEEIMHMLSDSRLFIEAIPVFNHGCGLKKENVSYFLFLNNFFMKMFQSYMSIFFVVLKKGNISALYMHKFSF